MTYARPETRLTGPAGATGAERTAGLPRDSVIDHPVPQTLFYAILFTIPYFRFRDLPGPFFMKVDYLLTATLLAIVIPTLIVNKLAPARLQANIWRPLAVFLLINIASALLSPYPDTSLSGLIILVAVVIFFTINLVMINDRGVDTYLPWVLGVSAGLNAFLACLGYYLGVDYFTQGGSGRGVGGTISANNMALMCVFVIPVMTYWAIFGATSIRRLSGLILAVVLIAGLVATESRGGFLNLVAVTGLLLLQYRHHFHPRYLGLVVGGGAALAFAVLVLVPQDYIQRQASLGLVVEWMSGDTQEISEDGALDRRAAYLTVAWDAFPERPILGSGPDTFREFWYRSLETRWFDMTRRPAHNTYVEVLIGTGLVGLAAFLFLLIVTFQNFLRAERTLRQAGDESAAHLVGAYKIAFLSVLIYFFVKSGIDHKYFILALPLSVAALRYAKNRVASFASNPSQPRETRQP
jgi:O-antigen ligase